MYIVCNEYILGTGVENMGGQGGNCPSTFLGGGAKPPHIFSLSTIIFIVAKLHISKK